MIWNMAALRQRQAPRRYKACGPVGEKLDAATPEMRERSKSSIARSIFLEAGHVSTCRDCGHHLCSCPTRRAPCVYCRRVHERSEAQCYQAAAGSYDANGGEPGEGP